MWTGHSLCYMYTAHLMFGSCWYVLNVHLVLICTYLLYHSLLFISHSGVEGSSHLAFDAMSCNCDAFIMSGTVHPSAQCHKHSCHNFCRQFIAADLQNTNEKRNTHKVDSKCVGFQHFMITHFSRYISFNLLWLFPLIWDYTTWLVSWLPPPLFCSCTHRC